MNKAHVTHPELKATFNLAIIGVKKNPNGAMYSSLGVITKGTIIEVNVSELGLVTPGGKVVWGKYAQVSIHCTWGQGVGHGVRRWWGLGSVCVLCASVSLCPCPCMLSGWWGVPLPASQPSSATGLPLLLCLFINW